MNGNFADGLSEFLGSKNVSKGVRITVEGHVVSAEVFVNIEYGGCIPEIALEIQEKVREAIENMTGYEVKIVDVHVQGYDRLRSKNRGRACAGRTAPPQNRA